MSDIIDFNNKKQELKCNKQKEIEKAFNIKTFNNMNEIIIYYQNVTNVIDEVDDNIYDILNNDMFILRNLDKQTEKKLVKIYNSFHKKYKDNNELYNVSILTSLLTDISSNLLYENEDVILEIVNKELNNKRNKI